MQRRHYRPGVAAEVIPGIGGHPLPECGFGLGLGGFLGFREQLALASAFRGEMGGACVVDPDLNWTQSGVAHLVSASCGSFGGG